MTRREHSFQVLEGKKPPDMPFFPDMTDWYIFHQTRAGKPRRFEPGQFVSDQERIHHFPRILREQYKDFTPLDFYREFDWSELSQ